MRAWPNDVAFVAEVYPDWTTLSLPDGSDFAFNRMTGKVYKVPHPECPFVVFSGLRINSEPPA
jgi:hypothetical protein